MHRKEYYLRKRAEYTPDKLRLIIVAESPPASGKYFYDTDGRKSEPLFSALMSSVLNFDPSDKNAGLTEFMNRGCILFDATYEPVDKGLTPKRREEVILRDYPKLRKDLLDLTPNKEVPLLLIKANVCRLLDGRLCADGFKTVNAGVVVPFPSSGQQKKFKIAIAPLIKSLG